MRPRPLQPADAMRATWACPGRGVEDATASVPTASRRRAAASASGSLRGGSDANSAKRRARPSRAIPSSRLATSRRLVSARPARASAARSTRPSGSGTGAIASRRSTQAATTSRGTRRSAMASGSRPSAAARRSSRGPVECEAGPRAVAAAHDPRAPERPRRSDGPHERAAGMRGREVRTAGAEEPREVALLVAARDPVEDVENALRRARERGGDAVGEGAGETRLLGELVDERPVRGVVRDRDLDVVERDLLVDDAAEDGPHLVLLPRGAGEGYAVRRRRLVLRQVDGEGRGGAGKERVEERGFDRERSRPSGRRTRTAGGSFSPASSRSMRVAAARMSIGSANFPASRASR